MTIELSPFQCAKLTAACRFASEESYEADVGIWRILADLFHACTIAGYAQWHLSAEDWEALLRQLGLLNLGNDDAEGDDEDKGQLNGRAR